MREAATLLVVLTTLALLASPAAAIHGHEAWDDADDGTSTAFGTASDAADDGGGVADDGIDAAKGAYDDATDLGDGANGTFYQVTGIGSDVLDSLTPEPGEDGSSEGSDLKMYKDQIIYPLVRDLWEAWEETRETTYDGARTVADGYDALRDEGRAVLVLVDGESGTVLATGRDAISLADGASQAGVAAAKEGVGEGHESADRVLEGLNDAAEETHRDGDPRPVMGASGVHGARDPARAASRPASAAEVGGQGSEPTAPTSYVSGARDGAGPAAPSDLARPIAVVGYAAVTAAGLALFVLYRRLTRDDVLENDLRYRMLEIVGSEPGIGASQIAERLDVAVTTVLYHGRVLADTGHLVRKEDGGRVAFLATEDAETILERELVCAMKRTGKRDLIELLADDPGLNISEAARRLDRNRSTIKRHADDLVDLGLVVDAREGRSRTLSLDPKARALVDGR